MAFPTAETNVTKLWLLVQNCYKHSLCLVALLTANLFFFCFCVFCFPVEILPVFICVWLVFNFLFFHPGRSAHWIRDVRKPAWLLNRFKPGFALAKSLLETPPRTCVRPFLLAFQTLNVCFFLPVLSSASCHPPRLKACCCILCILRSGHDCWSSCLPLGSAI